MYLLNLRLENKDIEIFGFSFCLKKSEFESYFSLNKISSISFSLFSLLIFFSKSDLFNTKRQEL